MMNCLANESLIYLKISPFTSSACRLLSSVTNSRNPLFISSKDSTSPTPFNPFQFFNDQTNSRLCTLGATRILQAHLLRRYLLPFDVFLTKSLLSWYSKSGSMVDAAKLFDTMPQPDVVSCNIMISGYKQNKLFDESWRFFSKMHFLGFEANEVSYVSVLPACGALQVPLFSELVCCHTIKMGFFFYEVVQSALIDSFSKSLRFQDAYKMFRDNLSSNNVYCWNTIIAGALRNQDYGAVFGLFYEMCGGFQKPDSYTYSSVLAACASLEKLRFGKAVQARAIKCGAEDVFVCTAIVDLYAKCGHMAEAREVFSRIPNPSGVSWTVMLSGCTKSNDAFSALEIFKEMRRSGVEINSFTVTSVIAACGRPSMVCEASQIHAWVLKSGFYLDSSVAASLISMYSKSEDIDLSEQVFEDLDDIQKQSIVNVMVSSFSQNKKPGKAIRLFTRMLQAGLRPDEFSVCSLLSVLYCLNLGKQIHSYTLKSGLVLDLTVGSSLFTMYSKCGSLEESFSLFKEIPVKDNACWASMISGFNEYGYLREAIGLFGEMLADGTSPDESTLAAVLNVCASLPSLPRGKEIHGYALRAGIDKGMPLGSALVNAYSKCGSLNLARQVYDRLPEMDPLSCSSLISGYSQHGLIQDGFLLFRDMVMSGFTMDSFAVSSILKAAVLSDESSLGAQVHAYITKIGLCTEPSVGSSLLTVYSKFGSIEDCCKAFSQINGPDLIAWTALIASYAQHGKATEALQVYNLMKEKGLKPDKVTLVGVLSACSHGGLVEEGYSHLNSMVKEYGIEPDNRHYACMVDALGRSGRLKEAESFINNMPIKADALVWGTLLAACRVYEDVELGKLAAKKAIELEPSDAGSYVSLSNILAEVGEWEEVEETRKLMKGTGVQKKPGWSFV